AAVGRRERLGQVGEELAAVAEAGQRIVERLVGVDPDLPLELPLRDEQRLLGLATLGDVGDDPVDEEPVAVQVRAGPRVDPACHAVVPPQAVRDLARLSARKPLAVCEVRVPVVLVDQPLPLARDVAAGRHRAAHQLLAVRSGEDRAAPAGRQVLVRVQVVVDRGRDAEQGSRRVAAPTALAEAYEEPRQSAAPSVRALFSHRAGIGVSEPDREPRPSMPAADAGDFAAMGASAVLRIASSLERLGTETAFSVLARAKTLERSGVDVIHLEIGEPDFDTPAHVREAAYDAIAAGQTHYGPTAGLPELRAAAAAYLAETRSLTIEPESVLVATGAKPFLFFTVLAVCQPGDEVVYPDPGFPIYESAIRFAGAVPVPLPLREELDFAFAPDELAARIGSRTRLVILNSPQNPTGGAIGPEATAAAAELIGETDAWVLSDEVYWRLL